MVRRLQVVAVLALLLVAGCPGRLPVELPGVPGPKVSEEALISAVMDDVYRGMQTRRVYKVLAHVSRNYHDEEGRDYQGIQAYLGTAFKQYRNIVITRVQPKILVQGDRARVVETFGTTADPIDPMETPPINVQGQVAVYLEKVNGRWFITEWGSVQ